MGICVGESDSEMRVIGNTGPGGAVQPSDLLQVLAVVVLLQREVQGDGGDRRDDHFGDHVAGVVGKGPQRRGPAQLVRPQGLPDDPAGHEVAGQTQQRGEHTADGDGHGAVLDALVKDAGKADDAERDDMMASTSQKLRPYMTFFMPRNICSTP